MTVWRRAAAGLALLLGVGCVSPAPVHHASPVAVVSPTGSAGLTPKPAPAFPPAHGIHVPRGFRAEIYASGLRHPTAMAYGPGGRLYVTEDVGEIVQVAPNDTRPHVVARGVPVPLGLAWIRRRLFVSATGRILSFVLLGDRLVARSVAVSGLPHGEHQQDNIVTGPDGRLYVGSGSTCNRCVESDPRSAAVLSLRPDGSDLTIVASGLRNPFGLAFRPGTDRLFASVNGIDYMGTSSDPEPADTVVLVRPGHRYGWPTCWGNVRLHALVGSCRGVDRPAAYLGAHASADGMAFYSRGAFPPSYTGNLFVAEWGAYDTTAYGRRVVRIVFRPNGTARSVSQFAGGFAHPLALVVDAYGALLVADWERGVIYRIQADGAP